MGHGITALAGAAAPWNNGYGGGPWGGGPWNSGYGGGPWGGGAPWNSGWGGGPNWGGGGMPWNGGYGGNRYYGGGAPYYGGGAPYYGGGAPTTVAAAHLITADTRTTVEMYPLLLRHRPLKILNTRL